MTVDSGLFVGTLRHRRFTPVAHAFTYPLFTPAGAAAQQRHHEISGTSCTHYRTHYCGAYWRYGFHEDGVVSALQALTRFDEARRHLSESGADDAQRALSRVA